MHTYQTTILNALNEIAEKYPLPGHLEYQVSLIDKLSTQPLLALFVVPRGGLKQGEEALAGIQIEIDPLLPLERQIEAIMEAVLKDQRFDLRDQLPEGTVQ